MGNKNTKGKKGEFDNGPSRQSSSSSSSSTPEIPPVMEVMSSEAIHQLASEIATPTTPTPRRESKNVTSHKTSISEITDVKVLADEIHKPERMPELKKIHSYVLHDTLDPLLSPDAPTPRKKSVASQSSA